MIFSCRLDNLDFNAKLIIEYSGLENTSANPDCASSLVSTTPIYRTADEVGSAEDIVTSAKLVSS